MINHVYLVGNLGKTPTLGHTREGIPITTLRIATTQRRTQRKGQTEWHRVVVLEEEARDCCALLTKGQQVCVEGRLQTRKRRTPEGDDRFVTEIVAKTVRLTR